MSNFFSSLFGGSNSDLNNGIKQTAQIGQYASGLGESDTTSASNFYSSLLSGDASKVAKTLAPQIGEIQSQKQQQLNSLGQFGNRSGGTNAQAQGIKDSATGQVNNLVGSLTSGAAGSLASMGSNLLGTGLGAINSNADLSQTQMRNWESSILGKSITSAISSAESAGLGAAGI